MTDPVKGLMQVNKYEFHGLVLTRPNAQTSVWDVSTGGQLCTDDEVLLKAGATPLIESEELLETDIETLASNLVWSNGTVKPGYLASTLAEIHMRLNALQKGVK